LQNFTQKKQLYVEQEKNGQTPGQTIICVYYYAINRSWRIKTTIKNMPMAFSTVDYIMEG
jgi:hypothetical protein